MPEESDPPIHTEWRKVLKGGALPRRIQRTKGGLNSKLHAVCDGEGRPIILLLSEGQMRDHGSHPCAGSRRVRHHRSGFPPCYRQARRHCASGNDPIDRGASSFGFHQDTARGVGYRSEFVCANFQSCRPCAGKIEGN